jgi:hypothetical protein
MRHAIRLATAATVCSLVGCITAASLGPVDTSTHTLVYGHIDAGKPLQDIEIAKMNSPRKSHGVVTPSGDFYFADVPPGDWGLMRFKAGDESYLLMVGLTDWTRFRFTARPGETKYVGTWKMTSESKGRFAPGHFSVERVEEHGSERAILKRLQPSLAGSGWEHRIRSIGAK